MTRFFQLFLYPIAVAYGLVLFFRNLLFDWKILPSKKFPIPLICIGNLSMGGTGKTPHTSYLVNLLRSHFPIATLSRGYGRTSRGYAEATGDSSFESIGDEPMEFKHRYPDLVVAVDSNRVRGIRNLLSNHDKLNAVLLDDAFQHRYVKPGLSILLTDYLKPYYEDYVVPCGTLREFRGGASRADIIIVTKTPRIFSPITRKRILEDIRPEPGQEVYFSFIKYGTPYPAFSEQEMTLPAKVTSILLFTGIANDYPLREHLERLCSDLAVEKFPDHHPYKEKDLQQIIKKYNDLPTQKKVIMTTEKDFMRLKNQTGRDYFKNLPLFCIPMEIDFHGSDKEKFDESVLNYVRKNQRNS